MTHATVAPAPDEPLDATNARVHALLDEVYLDALEALCRADVRGARAHLARFVDVLHVHMTDEEDHVLPRFVALGPVADDPHALRKIEGDHEILRRTLTAVVDAVAALDADDDGRARAVAARLDVYARLRGVLEHHTTREARDLYPRLDGALPIDERRAVAARLRRALDDGRGGAP